MCANLGAGQYSAAMRVNLCLITGQKPGTSLGPKSSGMDMFRVAIAAGFALLAAACGGSDGDNRYAAKEMALDSVASMPAPMAPPPPPPPMTEMSRADGAGAVAGAVNFNSPVQQQIIQQDQQGGGGGGQPAQLIAYTYNWAFLVPSDHMQDLLNAQKKVCEDAGPAKCYVTNSQISYRLPPLADVIGAFTRR